MIVLAGFSILAIVAAAFAILLTDTRKVIISAWVAAMSVGALFLAYGAEYLAFVQWITGTLVTISFLAYATMFGEYGVADSRTIRQRLFDLTPALVVGVAFFMMIGLAVYGSISFDTLPAGSAAQADLAAVGQALGERHLICLELIGFMLLGVLIGTGVLSRPARLLEDAP
jgi:NADH:ubiquinone oxidoreductase subunit 6 (subunit J)